MFPNTNKRFTVNEGYGIEFGDNYSNTLEFKLNWNVIEDLSQELMEHGMDAELFYIKSDGIGMTPNQIEEMYAKYKENMKHIQTHKEENN